MFHYSEVRPESKSHLHCNLPTLVLPLLLQLGSGNSNLRKAHQSISWKMLRNMAKNKSYFPHLIENVIVLQLPSS